MKTNSLKAFLPVALLLLAFITGCATAPPVDWSSRVGHYTYTQAVNELGPPNRQIRLSNGQTEFRWFLQPPPSNPSVGGMNQPGGNVEMNNNFGAGTGFHNRYLQLTFAPSGVLTGWSRNY